MSEITRAAIGMPFEMAMGNESSRRQFHSIAQALLAERDRLSAENAGLRTGYEAYERVNAELKAEVEKLRVFLLEAADEIDTWGSYASDYFQEKHDLAGCVAKFHAAAMGNGGQS